jgi:primosomal protein N' (replication factor Y)
VALEGGEDREHEKIWQIHEALALPPEIVEVCRRVAEENALPLAAVLRAALPPGLGTDRLRIMEPSADWPWRSGSLVGRATLRKALGHQALLEAERNGRVALDPLPEGPTPVEWAVATGDVDLSRAPKQRLLRDELLLARPAGLPVEELLERTGARRHTLRELVRREAASLERRPGKAPVVIARGPERGPRNPFSRPVERVLERGGAWVWRTPTEEQALVVAALVRAATQRGEQTLVLAPEIRQVEILGAALAELLPGGTVLALHHSKVGRDRAGIHAAARSGDVDVVVGTRTASLLTMARPGPMCVVDEPNEAHRGQPGFEGLPVHVREISLHRCAVQGSAALFLSPFPSLRLYGAHSRVREVSPRLARNPLDVRLIDMRGTGAALSREVVDACRGGDSVGVVANRLGYGTSVVCAGCGTIRACMRCELPLSVRGDGLLYCRRCGMAVERSPTCQVCGSDRLVPTGLTVERIRDDLASALNEKIGLRTAEMSEEGRVAVGTAHRILAEGWSTVIVPDVDAVLLTSGASRAERAFRLVFAAAEATRERLLVQTRIPEDEVLLAAVRQDYATFAAAELPRLATLGYPPFGHVVCVTLTGSEKAAWGAVESGLRGGSEKDISASDLVRVDPGAGSGKPSAWRLLLRSGDLTNVARAGARISRLAAGRRLRVRVDVDPEEV